MMRDAVNILLVFIFSGCVRDNLDVISPLKTLIEVKWGSVSTINREQGVRLYLFDTITGDAVTRFDANYNTVISSAPWHKTIVIGGGNYHSALLNGGVNSLQYSGFGNVSYVGNVWSDFRAEATELLRSKGEVVVNNPDTVVCSVKPLNIVGNQMDFIVKYHNGKLVDNAHSEDLIVDSLYFTLHRLVHRVDVFVSIVGFEAYKSPPARAAFRGFSRGAYIHNQIPTNDYVIQRFNFDVSHNIVRDDSVVMRGSFSSFGPPLNDDANRYSIEIFFNGNTTPHAIATAQINDMNLQIQQQIEQIRILGKDFDSVIELRLVIANPPLPGPEGGFSAVVDPWLDESIIIPIK